jgi:hypothetical protein
MNDLQNTIDNVLGKLEAMQSCMKSTVAIEKDVINKMYELILQKYLYIHLNIKTLSELLTEAGAIESDLLLLMNRNTSLEKVEDLKSKIESFKHELRKKFTNGNTAEDRLEALKKEVDKLYCDSIARERLSSRWDITKCAIEEVEKDINNKTKEVNNGK